MGDVVAAVDRYKDIPPDVRARLKARMEVRDYDEIVAIRRDSIEGRGTYSPEIRDMHFGQGSVCRTVSRTKWLPTALERGLVYCVDGQCILVPTVCRNVSRIRRIAAPPAVAAAAPPSDPEEPLVMDPTGAGIPVAPGATPPSFAELVMPAPSAGTIPAITSLPTGGTPGALGPTAALPGLATLPAAVHTAAAVPEPQSWTLYLTGLLTVGWVFRRRSASRI